MKQWICTVVHHSWYLHNTNTTGILLIYIHVCIVVCVCVCANNKYIPSTFVYACTTLIIVSTEKIQVKLNKMKRFILVVSMVYYSLYKFKELKHIRFGMRYVSEIVMYCSQNNIHPLITDTSLTTVGVAWLLVLAGYFWDVCMIGLGHVGWNWF